MTYLGQVNTLSDVYAREIELANISDDDQDGFVLEGNQ